MNGFGPNLSMNFFSPVRSLPKQGNEELVKNYLDQGQNQGQNPVEEAAKNIQQNQPNTNQAPANANLNASLNQSALNNPLINQSALNTTNSNQSNLDFKNNTGNTQVQATPAQQDFQGARDLPAYAGIANMSFKSWIANQDNKSFTNLESGEKQLTSTLEGIQGFQKKSSEDSDNGSLNKKNKGLRQLKRGNNRLVVLSQIFSNIEHNAAEDTELLVHINNFKKLGSNLTGGDGNQENDEEIKLIPPTPNELHKLEHVDATQIKCLYQLLALPDEFPEFLRLFAHDYTELNFKEAKSFLEQRFNIVKEQLFGVDERLHKTIEIFLPLLHSSPNSLLPLVLLYYPLPVPYLCDRDNAQWNSGKNTARKSEILASVEIYYESDDLGRFLIKLELYEDNDFNLNIQTSKDNQEIINDIEAAVAESMYLLEHPPNLSELNVLLTNEVYKATDINEQLSIISTGPLRLEIVLATYAILVVLNKLSGEIENSGLIEIKD